MKKQEVVRSYPRGYTNPTDKLKELLPEIVETITLQEIERLTKEFNQIFIDNLNEKKSNNLKK